MLYAAAFSAYKPYIRQLPSRPLTKADLLHERFLLAESGPVSMYYAPHNEIVNPHAQILIAGLTPGWSQMKLAFETARDSLQRNQGPELRDEDILQQAKKAARFAGPMRNNIIRMLDTLDLPAPLGLSSAQLLFEGSQQLMHTTSVLRYPVFARGHNYTGSRPDLLSSDFLRDFAVNSIQEELGSLDACGGFHRVLVIPLGKAVEGICRVLVQKGILREEQCLWGFPHPSGANGHRVRQFNEQRGSMREIIRAYFR
ncbi:hypothetical protein AWM70_17985 [Paenibacillus yonginensis]|uniref:Uracil-DNA glycosylase-like domain-containing protein n=1 Tax=Paenibacillus yonginensis TaxID=1462996 RepID=A0A1B1N464_9BACL|nr:hypothetical protein [Paenibacillus yonginensis]ANS76238.1 hypothetical protein AWM70_17985 [Paenibacillus yonginensis]